MNSKFAKISSRENISNSLFAKFSSRENKVLYSILLIKAKLREISSDTHQIQCIKQTILNWKYLNRSRDLVVINSTS